MKNNRTKPIIGRIEKIDFPEFSIYNLDAKIDTGAYTSSLHCHHIETFDKNDSQWVRFNVLDPNHPEYEDSPYSCPIHSIRSVKSSNGQIERRYTIKRKVKFFGKLRIMELTLTDRSEMKFPVLIGRKFLTDKFLVDVSKIYLTPKEA
ncbi:ATP-dependent zinc protease family protein [Rhodohalobacter halophilus]|uniref:ATP-dependent zinc protease family protein n=1 Tax=Rhodohalobacter halophilus TaxID=1812810 RepID=UPI000A00F754|nr:RimK/LysX family protein [Rhodohalobacter halophilus]